MNEPPINMMHGGFKVAFEAKQKEIDANDVKKDSMLLFLLFMCMFTSIYFTNALLKLYLFCVEKRQSDFMYIFETSSRSVKKNFFWKSFFIDYVTFQLPIIFYVTVLDQFKIVSFLVLCVFNFLIYKSITSHSNRLISIDIREANLEKVDEQQQQQQSSQSSLNSLTTTTLNNNRIDEKLIRISINAFRSLLFIITSVCILAVDFKLFPPQHAKRYRFGISLMDIGVGFFILCHSMRLIRNSSNNETSHESTFKKELRFLPKRLYLTAKNSSILLLIGFGRLVAITLTGYHFSYTEYGLHWNFFFTIFFVKLLACPFDVFIRKSSIRSFIVSMAIGIIYEYLLVAENWTEYLLDAEIDRRITIIDKNKEGIYSLIGYLSIYFAGEAICYRLKKIIQNKNNSEQLDQMKLAKKCSINILAMALIYWISLELTRYNVQNVSRKLSNLGFIFFIMTSATFLWFTICCVNIVMAKLVLSLLVGHEKNAKSSRNDEAKSTCDTCIFFLENAFSFVDLVDSKLIGLAVFLIANVFTGLVNLAFETKKLPTFTSLFILFANSFVSTLIPFVFYYYYFIRNNKKR